MRDHVAEFRKENKFDIFIARHLNVCVLQLLVFFLRANPKFLALCLFTGNSNSVSEAYLNFN